MTAAERGSRRITLPGEGVESAARAAAQILGRGGLVVFPTETVYGLAADPRIAGAEERIYAAKERDRGKPIPLMAASLQAVEVYGADLGPVERALAEAFWPGPLTLVLRVKSRSGGPAVREGFRVPASEVALAVLNAAGCPLRVTSANLSGQRDAVTADEAAEALGSRVELILDGGPAAGGVPSTVVECDAGTVRIIRAGAIPEARIRAVAGQAGDSVVAPRADD